MTPNQKIAALKKVAEKYLPKDATKLAREACDKSKGDLIDGLTPDVYFDKLRAKNPSDFLPKHVIPAKEFKKNFDGSYSVVINGEERRLSRDEMNQTVQCQTSDPEKPTWFVEFWD